MANKLSSHEAIEYAEANGLTLSKYEDPIEDAREGLTPAEARKIASEDPSLIYLERESMIEQERRTAGTEDSMNTLNISRADLTKIESLSGEQLAAVRINLQESEYSDDETREALMQACADGYDVEDFLAS
jgi:hypothetical protein